MEDEFFVHLNLFRNAELILNEGSQILTFSTLLIGVYKIVLSGTNMKAF